MLATLTDSLFLLGVGVGMPLGATSFVSLVIIIALLKRPNLSG
jgi:hypothetical protein